MYCKLFASLYQGTLRGRAHEILVFTNMLASASRIGECDKHWRAIAEEVGLTVDEVKAACANLEKPDVESRSPEDSGRRIVRLDEHRDWGWRIVNYMKYRMIRDREDRMEQNREAQRRRRARRSQGAPPKPPVDGQQDLFDEPGEPQGATDPKRPKEPQVLTDEQFLATLRTNPAYQKIDLEGELKKMDAWLLAHPGRKKTRRFVVNWLNKVEVPLTNPVNKIEIRNRITTLQLRINSGHTFDTVVGRDMRAEWELEIKRLEQQL